MSRAPDARGWVYDPWRIRELVLMVLYRGGLSIPGLAKALSVSKATLNAAITLRGVGETRQVTSGSYPFQYLLERMLESIDEDN